LVVALLVMTRKQASMRVKLLAAVVAAGDGEVVNVSAACRDAGVSRKTFYKWVTRYRLGGLGALEDRSTRPRTSPAQINAEVEDEIVRLRKELRDAGLDHGATTIRWHLEQAETSAKGPVPSVAGVHRVLVRRGLVEPQPKKRPKTSWKRFEAAAPNERWQIDAMDWTIASGVVRVFNIIDDHSRVAVASAAVREATTEAAWATFTQAAAVWGAPAGVLSDNGLCFSGKLRGFEVLFEANLRDAGIRPSTGRPYHPQTTGKVERFQQTLKKRLRSQDLAATIEQLQSQLDEFVHVYNNQRPHQGIGRCRPIERWNATPTAGPADTALAHPTHRTHRFDTTVTNSGLVHADGLEIGIGVTHAGRQVTVLIDSTDHATVLANGTLIRHLRLDRTRRYQPTGNPRGGPRQTRLPS
jgi:transposase InsO family protein